jgi:hypothetical protein
VGSDRGEGQAEAVTMRWRRWAIILVVPVSLILLCIIGGIVGKRHLEYCYRLNEKEPMEVIWTGVTVNYCREIGLFTTYKVRPSNPNHQWHTEDAFEFAPEWNTVFSSLKMDGR